MCELIGLFLWSAGESIIFPIPPDGLLMILALTNSQRAIIYGLTTTIGSLVGGIIGYIIGNLGGRSIFKRFGFLDKLHYVEELFHKYDTWAIFIAGFTPIPYKLFTLGGGLFSINFSRFVITSFISRGARFMLVSILVARFGLDVAQWIKANFDIITIIILLVVIGISFAFRMLKNWQKKSL